MGAVASDIDWQDKAQRWMALYERESAEYTRVALENARLTALLAERDAEIARLVELGERMRLSAMYYAANYAANGGDVLCIEFHAACEAWRAVLAARGGAS